MRPIVRTSAQRFAAVLAAGGLGALLFAATVAGQEKGDAVSDLLAQMNRHLVRGEYEEVLRVGKRIEEVDRYGAGSKWTMSVYATMGTSSYVLGQQAEKGGDPTAALAHYRRAAGYNRACANAAMLYYKRDGVTRKSVDADLERYK